MKMVGRVEVPQEAFIAALSTTLRARPRSAKGSSTCLACAVTDVATACRDGRARAWPRSAAGWAAWLDRLPRLVAEPARRVGAHPRRRADARVLLAGACRCATATGTAGGAQGQLRRRRRVRARGTSRSSTGTATARSGCSAPTRTAARCCSSGCTARTSPSSGTSRPARSWPASTPRLHVPAPPQLRTVTSYVERLARRPRPAAARRARSRAGWSSRRSRSAGTSSADPASTGAHRSTATCTTRTCSPPTASRGW